MSPEYINEAFILIAEGLDIAEAIKEISDTHCFTEIEEETIFNQLIEYFNIH